MVVIVLVVGREGPETSRRRVSFVSYVNINQQFRFAQVEPGETVATTKEGEYLHQSRDLLTHLYLGVVSQFTSSHSTTLAETVRLTHPDHGNVVNERTLVNKA